MKKTVLFLFVFNLVNLCNAQSTWSVSSNLQATSYGSLDTVNGHIQLWPYDSSFYQQPMKTTFQVINDSLYLIDTGKLENVPQHFFSKPLADGSTQIVLDTNLMDFYPYHPMTYKDEVRVIDFIQIYYLQDYEIKLNLGHTSSWNKKTIRYKSIYYKMDSLSTSTLEYSPEWHSSSLLADTAVDAPYNANFLVNIENNKIVIYHSASYTSSIGYNLNLSPIKNDTMFAELYPSKLMQLAVPLESSNKPLAIYGWYSPRFIVADLNSFTDTLRIGYYNNRANGVTYQSLDWLEIVKQANNTISYSPATLSNLNVPSPVQDIKLQVSEEGNFNLIEWITTYEENVETLSLEKSTDGINFSSIYTTNAQEGTEQNFYNYQDYAISENCYYRIKALDKDLSSLYSYVVYITREKNTELDISPNPSNSGLITIDGLFDADYRFILTTLDGKIISNEFVEIKLNSHQINLSSQPKGTYILSILNLITDQKTNKKIIKK